MMKNRLLFVAMLLLLILNFGSCGQHIHEFGEWEQVTAASCSAEGKIERGCECGYVEQRSVPRTEHTPGKATCTSVSTCTACGAITGSQLGHAIVEATCTTSAYCSECKAELGEKPDHKWQEATCAQSKICLVCLETQGEALGHSWQEATCKSPENCARCGMFRGSAKSHSWVEATCLLPKKCENCGLSEGTALGHDWLETTCTSPMICSGCGLTRGSAGSHKWIKNGEKMQCEYCGIFAENIKYSLFLNGDPNASQIQSAPTSNETATVTVAENGAVQYNAHSAEVKSQWVVDEAVDFYIRDNSAVIMIVTKDYCACGEDECYMLESCDIDVKMGNDPSKPKSVVFRELNVWSIQGHESYLFFYAYLQDDTGSPIGGGGYRLNSIDVTFKGINYSEKPEFSVCYIAFFDSVETAEIYANYSVGQMEN